jgi:TetR/AcrR family transcriptional regulator, repressor for neighboring sulfatase
MSTKPSVAIERRRKAESVREEALAIARRLLISGGPGAITLKAVGAEMGMSHANLIHHFGSAEAFRDQLKTAMVEELTRTVTALIRRYEAGEASVAEIVDTVFTAYAEGGIGTLVAWSALTPAGGDRHGLDLTIRELVAMLERLIEGPAAPSRARAMVYVVSLLAFGDSLIGKSMAKALGSEALEMRKLTLWILEQLRRAGG